MVDWLRYAMIAGALLIATTAYFGWRSDTGPGRVSLILLAVTEVFVLSQAVVAGVKVAGGHRLAEPATLIGYFATTVILLPAAWWWSRLERSKWGSLVVLVAGLVIAVLTVRLEQLWVMPV